MRKLPKRRVIFAEITQKKGYFLENNPLIPKRYSAIAISIFGISAGAISVFGISAGAISIFGISAGAISVFGISAGAISVFIMS